MGRYSTKLGTLTIPNGQQNSNEFNGGLYKHILGSAVDITVIAPATLPEVVKPQVSHKKNPGASDWGEVNVGNTDVACAAGDATVVPTGGARAFRLRAGAAVAADRVFEVFAQLDR